MSTAPLVTLIVPTVHHRAALFARTLRYLDDSGFAGPIVVSDHSPVPHAGVVEEIVNRHPRLGLRLLRHDPELHFLNRLALCAQSAQTPYVHLHADDDFLVLPTLDKLVQAMQRDPGCSAALGINLQIDPASGQSGVKAKRALPQAGAFERLLSQLEAYSSVLYALRRREELIATFSFSVERCPDVQFWQHLETCVAALRGPCVLLEAVHYVRSEHPQKWSLTLVRERSRDHFPYLILSPHFAERVGAFRAALVEACAGAGTSVDAVRLDNGLIHLLHRSFGAMGLPERSGSVAWSEDSAKATFARLQPTDPAALALQRIFKLLKG
jgi:glycosyltransferase domain-containing protein